MGLKTFGSIFLHSSCHSNLHFLSTKIVFSNFHSIRVLLSRFLCHHNQFMMGRDGGEQAHLDQIWNSVFSRDPSGSSWRPSIELVDWAASGRCEAVSPFHKHFMARGGIQEIGPRSRALSSTAGFRLFKHAAPYPFSSLRKMTERRRYLAPARPWCAQNHLIVRYHIQREGFVFWTGMRVQRKNQFLGKCCILGKSRKNLVNFGENSAKIWQNLGKICEMLEKNSKKNSNF